MCLTILIFEFWQILFFATIANSDTHWIAHYITFDRVPSNHLDDSKPIVANIADFENINYLLSKAELEQQRKDYIILVARVLIEYFTVLQPLRDVIPSHVPHRYNVNYTS